MDTLVWTTNEVTDAMRAQMPQFGISKKVTFPQLLHRFSLGFEEGMWALPWVDVKSIKGDKLEKLIVKFVYSGGSIHSVSSEAIYKNMVDNASNAPIEVDYQWLEEAPVDIQGGASVMLMVTLIASITFLVQACSLSDEDITQSDGNDNEPSYGSTSAMAGVSTPGVPKWD